MQSFKELFRKLALLHSISFLTIFFVTFVLTYYFKYELALQIVNTQRNSLLEGDSRRVITTLKAPLEKNFSSVTWITTNGHGSFQMPLNDPLPNLDYGKIRIDVYFDEKRTSVLGTFTFGFSLLPSIYFSSVSWIFCILLTLPILNWDRIRTSKERLLKTQLEINQSKIDFARQVAHDIRSPLSALEMATFFLSGLTEDQQNLIRSATKRIHDIANNLLNKGDNSPPIKHPQTACSPIPLIREIIKEKSLQFYTLPHLHLSSNIDPDADHHLLAFDPNELNRILSNLIDNSVAALEGAGDISVTLKKNSIQYLELIIDDNGPGFPLQIFDRLGEKGFSFSRNGSKKGHGLGLHYTIVTIERFGGVINLTNRPTGGASVSMHLPILNQQENFS